MERCEICGITALEDTITQVTRDGQTRLLCPRHMIKEGFVPKKRLDAKGNVIPKDTPNESNGDTKPKKKENKDGDNLYM